MSEETLHLATEPDDELEFCTIHPDRETALRCNKCGRPMCTKCAVRTPVGYRCRECVHEQQDVYFSATQWDYVIGAVAAGVISFVANLLVGHSPFILLIIIVAPVVGGIIAQIILRLVRRRRGRYMGEFVVVGLVLGALASQWQFIEMLSYGMPISIALELLLWPAIFTAIMAFTVYGWFRFGKRI